MDPTQRFTDRVADYVRYRPGYPEGVLEILRAETDLDSRAVVADIGSGTGISTELFLRNGNTVYAVEPNRAMREAAEAVLGGRAGFRSVDGSAEATTLPDDSVDYAVAGQAFHWFDAPRARREFGRILRISGWSVLLWNDRRIDSTPFLRDYEALLIRFGTDYTTVQHRNVSHERLASFFGPNGFTTRRLYNEQRFDFDGLKGRLLSSSYVPAPGHPDHPPMMEDLKRKFERHEDAGEVTFEYDTVVHFGRMG